MPYIQVPAEMFMEHGGVQVFHVYREGTNEPWGYWFTTDRDTADECHAHGQAGHFDARLLAGRWSETPNIREWDDFWRPRFKREDDAIHALIVTAIDEGRLPHQSSAAR